MPQSRQPRSEIDSGSEGIVKLASASGGWPYLPGQSPRIEPTAWALLALGTKDTSPDVATAVAGGVRWLEGLQGQDGLLAEPGMPGPNYGWNGLALLAALAAPPGRPSRLIDRLFTALLDVKGIRLDNAPGVLEQDNTLQGWSWTQGTFSWVEPTAYCLLAVKKAGSTGPMLLRRIAEAEAVLVDRACEGGGWNYGNSQVLGQDLRPYVPTTALALLALQDKAPHPVVEKGLAWLADNALTEPSAMALSLSSVALRAFGRPVEPILTKLSEQESRTGFLQNVHLMALARFAATSGDNARALRLP